MERMIAVGGLVVVGGTAIGMLAANFFANAFAAAAVSGLMLALKF